MARVNKACYSEDLILASSPWAVPAVKTAGAARFLQGFARVVRAAGGRWSGRTGAATAKNAGIFVRAVQG